ncbi:TrlF family AAA-like ATPase [Flavobacterium artemisiae]|uniref:TrlF family AAA-like ATPase n=1 Tax=Flavobacterium artemisiae TaxID=2126556 RepID=A0ABW4HJC4_9FLAO
MNSNLSNRGSQWRKWDLHIHTPYSIEQDYGGYSTENWDRFINELENLPLEIKVLGINDYIFLEGYKKVLKEKAAGRLKNIDLLLPVIELRIDKFGNLNKDDAFKRVNFHVIFSPELSPEAIEGQFLNSLTSLYKLEHDSEITDADWGGVITRESLQQLGEKLMASSGGKLNGSPLHIGFNSFNVSYSDLLIKLQNPQLQGKFITAVGKTEWDALRWDASPAEKKTVINNCHLVFCASPTVGEAAKAKAKLIEQNVNSNLLHCSDAHGYAMPEGKTAPKKLGHCFTWIKADTTFEGLKQIIHEPEQRVRIQNDEPDQKEDSLVIEEVRFVSDSNLFTPESILLNSGLNVIIGGKSSGKSILLYNIARTLLTDRAILKTDDKKYRYEFGTGFDFIVKMRSGLEESVHRDDLTPSILSEIKYIPQNYLSKLAEPENKKGNELQKLVRGLLLEDSLSKYKYQDFINIVTSNDSKRELIINSYFDIKAKLLSLNADLLSKGSEEALNKSVKDNEEKITKLKESIGMKPEDISKYNLYNEELQTINIEINSLRADHSKLINFNTEAKSILKELASKRNLALQAFEVPAVKEFYENFYVGIDEVYRSLEQLEVSVKLDENRHFVDQDNIFNRIFSSKVQRQNELLELLKPFLKDAEIKKQIEELEKIVQEYKQKLSVISQLKTEIKSCREALSDEIEKVFSVYRASHDEYIKIVHEIGKRAGKLKDENLTIKGIPRFNFPKLRKKILEISDGRRGSYQEYATFAEEATAVSDYNLEAHIDELKTIFSKIEAGEYFLNSKTDQKNAIKILLDDYFFDYWEVTYDSDTLDKMSTGKASFVILMLIIGLSESPAPILIDQPEDNLDNRSITKDLVSYLRNKKQDRQIILVTHNPNIVVNADAENIIVANQKGQNDVKTSSIYQFDYINGSIENSFPNKSDEKNILLSMGIREHIADIVEGGKDAFKKREKKYGFKNTV